MRRHAKSGKDPQTVAILLLSGRRPSAILHFKKSKFLQSTGHTQSKCVITPNLVKIVRTVAEIRADNNNNNNYNPICKAPECQKDFRGAKMGHWVMGHGSWVKRVNEYG